MSERKLKRLDALFGETPQPVSGQLLPSKTPKRTAVKIKPVVLKKYFKKGESAKEIEAIIATALEFYFTNANAEK